MRVTPSRAAARPASAEQPAVQRVGARMRGLGQHVRVDRLAHLRAGEAALDRRARDAQRVQREHVVVDQRVVERRERAVVAEVVAGHLARRRRTSRCSRSGRGARRAASPGRVLPRAVKPRLNSPSAMLRQRRRQVDQHPVEEVDARQVARAPRGRAG